MKRKPGVKIDTEMKFHIMATETDTKLKIPIHKAGDMKAEKRMPEEGKSIHKADMKVEKRIPEEDKSILYRL
jgi:hypothetical protein